MNHRAPTHARRPSGAATTLLALAVASGDTLRARGLDWNGAKQWLRTVAKDDPLDALAVTVVGSALLFWVAERDVNPGCRRFEDALVFISTCLSVGYARVHAVTPAGKAIASVVMAVGPAMAAAALNAPAEGDTNAARARGGARPREAPQDRQERQENEAWRTIPDKLDAILHELRAARTT